VSDLSGKIVGIDIGLQTAALVVGRVGRGGQVTDTVHHVEAHQGDHRELFRRWYGQLELGGAAAMAATGRHGGSLAPPVLGGIPDELAQQRAAEVLLGPGPLNIVRIGAGGYSVLALDGEGGVRYEENDRCSSGAGEMVSRTCRRLGVSLEEATRLAERASTSQPIAARCSVFAKSELTHHANAGVPRDVLLRGFFEGIAGNLHGLIARAGARAPVFLIGGGARNRCLVQALGRLCGTTVQEAPHASTFEARGAMRIALERLRAGGALHAMPDEPEVLMRDQDRPRIEPLVAPAVSGHVHVIPAPVASSGKASPAILGMDLGSTGSKAVLVERDSGVVIESLYRRTGGDPISASRALVSDIVETIRHPVVAVALTGSGRYAARDILRAALANGADPVEVHNEIVAHAHAAMSLDPQRGESLSIIEIGGQDAKFINVAHGLVLEADLNRACSAGTGSFLEEQARAFGVQGHAEFSRLAATSRRPPDLGQTCTVFVADLAARALEEGYSLADVLAGLQHSVIRNYLNRVMGNRPLLDRVFFQGKPASDPTLAGVLQAITGRDVVVPPDPGGMGALGAALLTRTLGAAGSLDRPLDLRSVLTAEVVRRRTVVCRDRRCDNHCPIELVRVQTDSGVVDTRSGGRCPKHEDASATRLVLPRGAPDPFAERGRLLVEQLPPEDGNGGPRVALPVGHHLEELAPLLTWLLHGVGVGVELVRAGDGTLSAGDSRCSAPGACAPVKLMHGLAATGHSVLVAPKVAELEPDVAGAGTQTCPLAQATPDMLRAAAGGGVEVVAPTLSLSRGIESRAVRRQLRALCAVVVEAAGGGDMSRFDAALSQAVVHQRELQQGLLAIGERTLAYAREHDLPVVLLVGNPHVLHEPQLNADLHGIIGENGALALPVDCLAVPGDVPPLGRVYWSSASRTLRASLAAASTDRVYPLLLLAYGCGPGSFTEHFFNDLMEGYPHAIVESDGHGGRAGYVTRVQAFLHSVQQYRRRSPEPPTPQVERYDRTPVHSLDELRDAHIVVMTVGPKIGDHVARTLRARGYQAEFCGVTDARALSRGRASCSGKECLPYQLIWGAYRRHLEEQSEPHRDTRLLCQTGFGPCRNGVFTLAEEIALERMGLAPDVSVTTFASFAMEPTVLGSMLYSMVVTDILNLMRLHFRPRELHRGDADRLFDQYLERLDAVMDGLGGGLGLMPLVGALPRVVDLVAAAAQEYASLPLKERLDGIRNVYLAGDIYLRLDEWGSDDLARKLNDHGLSVWLEPFSEIFEFVILRRSKELIEISDRWLNNRVVRFWFGHVVDRLYRAAQATLPWLRHNPISEVVRSGAGFCDDTPFCESICTIGSVLHAWEHLPLDGVVVVSPQGCGPALISEAQLRRSGVPCLFVYTDGDPLNQDHLSRFVWQIRHGWHPGRKMPHSNR